MNSNDLDVGGFFTTNGTDIWKLKAFYSEPSCKLENVETKEIVNFGMGGITSKEFHRIQMPKAALNKAKSAKQPAYKPQTNERTFS